MLQFFYNIYYCFCVSNLVMFEVGTKMTVRGFTTNANTLKFWLNRVAHARNEVKIKSSVQVHFRPML